MNIRTGTFQELGRDYETGTNAALLAAIAQSAEELTSGKGWPDGVHDLLAALGRATGVSRVWIFQTIGLTETHITQDYTFEWAAAPEYRQIGMPIFSMHTNAIDRPGYRDMVRSRMRGEWQKVLVSPLAPGWLKDDLVRQGILSMLTIPVMVEGAWWGTLGFDDCERAYDWSDVEIALLRTAGYLISNAVLRDQLSAKRRQFDILRQLTESNIWQLDLTSGHLWCTADILYSVPVPSQNLRFSLREALRLVHPGDRGELVRAARAYMGQERDEVFRHDLRVLTDCGGLRWVELIANVRRNPEGRPEQLAGIAVDIRRRKQEEQRLRTEAVTDPLTGAMNRRKFEQELAFCLEGKRAGQGRFSLLLLDVDRFKDLNDRYGHLAGDEVLKRFAAVCQDSLRRGDSLARFGGDEFAVLLPGTPAEAARDIAERIRCRVEEDVVNTCGACVACTVSIGCTTHPGGLATPAQLIERADTALYEAKQRGRNRLVQDAGPGCMV